MRYFNYNGKLLPEGTAVFTPDSRAVRYGDGLFETLKVVNGNIVLAGEHFARLWKGLQALRFEVPKLLTPEKLSAEILQLAAKNKDGNSRVRLTMYRGNGGLYDAVNHAPDYTIQTWPLPPAAAALNSNGLQLCIYKDARKTCDALSQHKHNNYLPYVLAALHAKENKCNDALLLNQHGRLADSTIANLFIIQGRTITTPPLTEGCVAGILRRLLLQALPDAGYTVQEAPVTMEDLAAADEVFVTNSIHNIRWVAAIEQHTYGNKLIQEIDNSLRQTIGADFC